MKITCAHGTAKQFEEAVKNRIEELGGDAETITSATEAIDNGEYITALYHEIKDNIGNGISVNLEASDEDKIIFVASDGNRIVSFEVPYSDIEFDWDAFDINVDLIQRTIEDEFDSLEASTAIQSSEDWFDEPKYQRTVYMPTSNMGKVELIIGAYTDEDYEEDDEDEDVDVLEILLNVVVGMGPGSEFELSPMKVREAANLRTSHEYLSGFYDDDEYEDNNYITNIINKIADFFIGVPQDEVDRTLIDLADNSKYAAKVLQFTE